MNFEYLVNDDGTFSLYNTEIEDIYFSNVGAHKEALEKFVIPALSKEFQSGQTIKILDVCYGMGYNSKSFVDFCSKKNFDYKFEIDAIEIDKNILTLGLLIFDKNISSAVHLNFNHQIYNSLNIEKNIENLLGENWINDILYNFKQDINDIFLKNAIYLHNDNNLSARLHNIYYQNFNFLNKNIKIRLFLDDLIEILPKIENNYDLIFHDAFSIRKQPLMWSDFVMNNYFRLLKPNGMFLTYSNSRVLRRLLAEIGFNVQINYTPDGKQNGTIAIKE